MAENTVIGICGGSGAGKTRLAHALADTLAQEVTVLSLDRYYEHRPDLSYEERKARNWDTPEQWEWELIHRHITALKQGEPVTAPVFDFTEALRTDSETVTPAPVIIAEGIFAFHTQAVNQVMDVKLFLDPPPDIRAVRRIQRDVEQRDYTVQDSVDEYLEQTLPMHREHVEPLKQVADTVLPTASVDAARPHITPVIPQKPGEKPVSPAVTQEGI